MTKQPNQGERGRGGGGGGGVELVCTTTINL